MLDIEEKNIFNKDLLTESISFDDVWNDNILHIHVV